MVDLEPHKAPGASSTASRLKKVVWSARGGLIFTGDDGGMLRAWDVATLQCVRSLQLAGGAKDGIMDIEQSADGLSLFVAGGTCASIVDLTRFEARSVVDMGPGGELEAVSLHPSRRWALIGGVDTFVRLYDLQTGAREPIAELRGHHGKVHSLRFSLDGSFFVSGADDATVRKWDLDKVLASSRSSVEASSGTGGESSSRASAPSGGSGGATGTAAAAAGHSADSRSSGAAPTARAVASSQLSPLATPEDLRANYQQQQQAAYAHAMAQQVARAQAQAAWGRGGQGGEAQHHAHQQFNMQREEAMRLEAMRFAQAPQAAAAGAWARDYAAGVGAAGVAGSGGRLSGGGGGWPHESAQQQHAATVAYAPDSRQAAATAYAAAIAARERDSYYGHDPRAGGRPPPG